MLVAVHVVTDAVVPLKVTLLEPWGEPKFIPEIVTGVPAGPLVGLSPEMFGGGTETVNVTPLLERPLTVTTTLPVVAPVGTGATMLVAVQVFTVAVVLLNTTLLEPCVDPKFVPVIVTNVPTGPLAGLSFVMLGACLLDCASIVVGRRAT